MSKVPDGVDLLSLFLEDRAVFTDDVIVDELIGFFVAGANSTHHTMQTFISHCA